MKDGAIGGYFGWPHLGGRNRVDVPSIAFRSARSALAAFLAATRPTKLWIPHHVCGAVSDAAGHAGTTVARFQLGEDMGLPTSLQPGDDDWVLVVDYLGLTGTAIAALAARMPTERIIVDASQAWYRPRLGNEAILYSPRKTFALPDGGWIASPLYNLQTEGDDEEGSKARAIPMQMRAAGDIQGGYARFREAEASLARSDALPMSHITRDLLSRQDPIAASTRRRKNYMALAAHLNERGVALPSIHATEVPLYAPITIREAEAVRSSLAAQKVFSPMFWPDSDLPVNDLVGRRLRNDTLYLPCDQRYEELDMARIVEALDLAMAAAGRHYAKG